jgi:hypothetical protein
MSGIPRDVPFKDSAELQAAEMGMERITGEMDSRHGLVAPSGRCRFEARGQARSVKRARGQGGGPILPDGTGLRVV